MPNNYIEIYKILCKYETLAALAAKLWLAQLKRNIGNKCDAIIGYGKHLQFYFVFNCVEFGHVQALLRNITRYIAYVEQNINE